MTKHIPAPNITYCEQAAPNPYGMPAELAEPVDLLRYHASKAIFHHQNARILKAQGKKGSLEYVHAAQMITSSGTLVLALSALLSADSGLAKDVTEQIIRVRGDAAAYADLMSKWANLYGLDEATLRGEA